MKFSVIISTYNRADYLRATLRNLSALRTEQSWELIVVDNNSQDHTRAVVDEAARSFPVIVRYLFEPEQGKYAALNTAIRAASGEIIALTDDDAQVEPDWLERAAEALDRFGCDYVGGKVLPIWGGRPPKWLPNKGGKHWAVIALLDYGPDSFELVDRSPLGVNLAVRREAFDRAGLFDNRLGRKAGTLRNQAQREWCLRARAAGVRGFYVPEMIVHHLIPQERLSKRYFRRWMYWNGISRTILHRISGTDIDGREKVQTDVAGEYTLAGIPQYMYQDCLSSSAKWFWAFARGDAVASFGYEMRLWFIAGVLRERWKGRTGFYHSVKHLEEG